MKSLQLNELLEDTVGRRMSLRESIFVSSPFPSACMLPSNYEVSNFLFWGVEGSRQGFSVALVPVLELAPVDQAGLELTKIRLRSAGIKGVRHHCPASLPFLVYFFKQSEH